MPVESLPISVDAARAALPRVTLVLGGTRSGKSRFAERLVERAAAKALYIATAERGDAEMTARIAAHRARRGVAWATREEPLELVNCLLELPAGSPPVLVDCLTLWLSNLMGADRDIGFETQRLCGALAEVKQPVVLVANEVGLGIVPDNALARAFRDHAGRLNQSVAALAERVVFVAAGLPLTLKG